MFDYNNFSIKSNYKNYDTTGSQSVFASQTDSNQAIFSREIKPDDNVDTITSEKKEDTIIFKPFEDVESAKKFLNEKFNITVDGKANLETMNYIAEGIVNIYNKTHSINITHINLKNINKETIGRYDIKTGELDFNTDYINRIDSTLKKEIKRLEKKFGMFNTNKETGEKTINIDTPITKNVDALLKQFLEDPTKMSLKQKLGLYNALYEILDSKIGSDKPTSINEFHVFNHEMGHASHEKNVGKGGMAMLSAPDQFPLADKQLAAKKEKIYQDFQDKLLITVQVSTYATTSPEEFVAEVYAGLIDGKTYSEEVMALYRSYKGPEVKQ